MTHGKRGTWIKTGVSWEQLLGNRQTVPVFEEQRRLLRRIRVIADANGPGYRYGAAGELDIAEVGPALVIADEAHQLGVEFLLGPGLAKVDVRTEPAQLELRAIDNATGVRLEPELRIDGEVVDPARVQLLGLPAFGCLVLDRP